MIKAKSNSGGGFACSGAKINEKMNWISRGKFKILKRNRVVKMSACRQQQFTFPTFMFIQMS
jgi:hypothetical protein